LHKVLLGRISDGVAWSLLVCLSVTILSPAKMAEPIKMLFMMWGVVQNKVDPINRDVQNG